MGERSRIEKGITDSWMLWAFRAIQVAEKQSVEWNPGFAGDVAQVFDDGHDEWDPFFAAQFFRFTFGVAGNQRTVGAGGWFGGAEDADIVVDLALEGIGVDEAVDAHGAEEMADTLADAAFRNFQTEGERRSEWAPIRAAEHGTENVNHYSQGVTFVASAFAIGTQGQECATVYGVVGICCGAALAVNAPAGWDGLTLAPSHFDFSERRGTGSHVNHNGRLFLAGEGDGDGIGAQHALHAPEGRDQASGVGHGPADQVALQRLEHVVAGDAEMICVSNADPAGPGFVRHFHGDAIRLRADHQAQSVVAIDGGGTQRRSHRGDSGFRIDMAFAEHSKIAIEPGDAMRIDAAQIRASEYVGSLRGVFLGHAKVEKDARTEFAQSIDVKNLGFHFGHVSPHGSRIRRFAKLAECNSFCAQNHRPAANARQAVNGRARFKPTAGSNRLLLRELRWYGSVAQIRAAVAERCEVASRLRRRPKSCRQNCCV